MLDKRKIIIDVLVILVSFAVFVIWYESTFKNNVALSSTMKHYQVYLVTTDKTNKKWVDIDKGATDMAHLMGVSYKWESPEDAKAEELVKVINQIVDSGADAILVALYDAVQIANVIEDAKAHGVKIIYLYSNSYEEAVVTLATDHFDAGITAAETMLYELNAIGVHSGKIGIVGQKEDDLPTTAREKGFREAINKNGKFELLPTVYSNSHYGNYQKGAEYFIKEYPDLVGLYGTNTEATIGVGNAIRNSNKEIVGIGFDHNDLIESLINSGDLKAVLTENVYTMGYLGVAEAIAALKGLITGPAFINTDVKVINEYTHH